MEYSNELLDSFVGEAVLIKQLAAPEPNAEVVEMIKESLLNTQIQLLHSRTAVMVLVSYDRLGVVLELIEEDPKRMFVPWSAVIEISVPREGEPTEEQEQQANKEEEEGTSEQPPGRTVSPAEKGREHEGGV